MVQTVVKDGRVTLRKTFGKSDVLTKYSDKVCCTMSLGLVGISVVLVESTVWTEGTC